MIYFRDLKDKGDILIKLAALAGLSQSAAVISFIHHKYFLGILAILALSLTLLAAYRNVEEF